jgi:hypothetical protein
MSLYADILSLAAALYDWETEERGDRVRRDWAQAYYEIVVANDSK